MVKQPGRLEEKKKGGKLPLIEIIGSARSLSSATGNLESRPEKQLIARFGGDVKALEEKKGGFSVLRGGGQKIKVAGDGIDVAQKTLARDR